MMKLQIKVLIVILILSLLVLPGTSVQAERGLPGSGSFGYGLQIVPEGPFADLALQMSANLGVDWVLLELDWAANSPDNSSFSLSPAFLNILDQAVNEQYRVMISLTQPPDWAMTPYGPSVDAVNRLITAITQRYVGESIAFELFPAPNTFTGWGTTPDPAAYATLFSKLQELNPGLLLVSGGLVPANNTLLPDVIADLDFLQGLYQFGLKDKMPVVGVLANQLQGQPLDAPGDENNRVFRHYEEIRQVMLRNQHETGLIWVTRLTAPAGLDLNAQNNWLAAAYPQIRSQLYAGAVFYQSANPDKISSSIPLAGSLVLDNNNYHPFYASLRELIAFNAPDDMQAKRGRSKGFDLAKNR